MAVGNQERRDLLLQLEARRAALSHAALEGTQARVGDPARWPIPNAGERGGAAQGADTPRITIRETADGLGVHVPAVRNIPLILFLLVWLAGWSAGEIFALHEIITGGFGAVDLFLVVWVSAWTIGGLAAWHFLLWQMFGVERLFVTGGAVVTESGFGPLRRRRVWRLDEVGNPARTYVETRSGQNSAVGTISFEADGRSYRFGVGLTETEAEEVLAAMLRYMPSGPQRSAQGN